MHRGNNEVEESCRVRQKRHRSLHELGCRDAKYLEQIDREPERGLDACRVAFDQFAAAPDKISLCDMSAGNSGPLVDEGCVGRRTACGNPCTDVLATILHGALSYASPL